MKNICILYSVGVLFVCGCYAANILIFIPGPFYSHQATFRPLWTELAKRGHNITLLTRNLMEPTENIKQIDLSGVYKIMENHDINKKFSSGAYIWEIILSMMDLCGDIIDYDFSHPEVKNLLKNEQKFDLLISEYMITYGFAFGNKFKIPKVAVFSMDAVLTVHDQMGNPSHPAVNPDHNLPFVGNLNFKQRLISFFYDCVWRLMYIFILLPTQSKNLKKYFPEIEAIDDISKDISIAFINANPIFSDIRPLGPNTISIGEFIHITKGKPLPKDLQDYLDSSPEGVIFFSLGSSVRSKDISNETKNVIMETFSQLPYKVLWKFETEELEGKPSNVKIKTWLPQIDVMRHKNIKLFITQGGLQSMEEALYFHVPMIGLPFFGDQYSNVNRMVEQKFGLSLDRTNLKVNELKEAILEVINNPSYKQKAKELVDLVLDQPMTGLEKAVWWTEYVIRHKGAPHFRNPIVDLPFYQYYLLDVISFIVLVLLCIIFVFYLSVKLLRKLIRKLYTTFISDKTKQE